MNKHGINKNGVTYLRLNDDTSLYYFVYYLGDGVELTGEKIVKNQQEIDSVTFTDLLPTKK